MPSLTPWVLGPWVFPTLISLVTLIVGIIKLQRAESRLDAIRTNDLHHLFERADHVDACLKEIERKLDSHIDYHLQLRSREN